MNAQKGESLPSGSFSGYANLPDVWGEGALFAFSGMDGPTDTRSGFVLAFGARPFDLLIHTPRQRLLAIRLPEPVKVLAATGDALVVLTPGGNLTLAFTSWHTLCGWLPEGGTVDLFAFDEVPVEDWGEGRISTGEGADVLALGRRGERFSLAFGSTLEEACARAETELEVGMEVILARRLERYRQPILNDPGRDRLIKKCLSVMRVNTLSAEGAICQPWSTPDRVPHRHMWLWDSVFHSLAMNRVDPRLAWHFLKAVLDAQRADGMIPHMITASGMTSTITQPPLLAWGVWENYTTLRDRETLRQALEPLERYLEWDLAHRDQDSSGLLEWFIEGDVNCRSGESGMDNSPRFDGAILMDAVDFSTFAAQDMSYLSRIARELGEEQRAAVWQARAEGLAEKIFTELWDPVDGFYYDRAPDGEFVRVRAVSGFLPLLLPGIPVDHVTRLVGALRAPDLFDPPVPIPSLATSHPAYSTDMWRGATWVNFNFLICLGLSRQGQEAEAARLAKKTVQIVDRYYREYGVLFEFFDSSDRRPPPECDRKGKRQEPYNIRRKMDSIRDYHWTAALTALMLWTESMEDK